MQGSLGTLWRTVFYMLATPYLLECLNRRIWDLGFTITRIWFVDGAQDTLLVKLHWIPVPWRLIRPLNFLCRSAFFCLVCPLPLMCWPPWLQWWIFWPGVGKRDDCPRRSEVWGQRINTGCYTLSIACTDSGGGGSFRSLPLGAGRPCPGTASGEEALGRRTWQPLVFTMELWE